MATRDIQLPEIGEGVAEGELVKWLVKPGDKVRADQPIAELMTDKATVEVPSPVAGIVRELRQKEGDVVNVGAVMITLDPEGASAPAPKAVPAPAPAAAAPGPKAAPSLAAVAQAAPALAVAQGHGATSSLDVYPPAADAKVLATPATRRLARETGVDLNVARGTGIAGRVTRDDVLRLGAGAAVVAGAPGMLAPPAATSKPSYQGPAGAAEERVPLKGIRKKIAENLQMAKHIIPHFTLMDEANVSALVRMREDLKPQAEKLGIKVTYLPFVVKALVATMREFPMFNASIDDAAGEIVYKKYFNIGFAADTPSGLLVPVIKDADRKTVAQVAREIGELSKKARDGKLALDEMRGATATITNIGSVGGTYATPIINHPEVAILGMYKISDKPVFAADGSVRPIKSMNFTITADHRLIDGAVAANFLAAFIRRIESPGALMLDMI
jgi:pyruvate dehydrogenase E2 component (dihydrolipoamide acetyltransferase)